MPSTFSISISGTELSGAKELSYTVTNTGTVAVRGRADLLTPGNGAPPALKLDGSPYREFAPNATEQFTIRIAPGAKPGTYSAFLRMVDDEHPNDVAVDGQTFTYEVAAPAPPKPFPRWMLAAIAAVVVLMIGTIVVFVTLSNAKVRVPDLLGKTLPEAQDSVSSAKLQIAAVGEALSDKPVGTVVDQIPTAGSDVEENSGVFVILATAPPPPNPVAVPRVAGLTLDAARQSLTGANLRSSSVQSIPSFAQPVNRVVLTTPGEGTLVPPSSLVELSLATDPEPVRIGQLTLNLNQGLDLDRGITVAANDATADIVVTNAALESRGNARVRLLGAEAPLGAGCAAANPSATQIPLAQLILGRHVCIQTGASTQIKESFADARVTLAFGGAQQLGLAFRTYNRSVFIFQPLEPGVRVLTGR